VLVVTTRAAPPDCAATIVDRKARLAGGALALRRVGPGWEITAARPPSQNRPWAPATRAGSGGARSGTATAEQPAPRDATPRAEDLAPED